MKTRLSLVAFVLLILFSYHASFAVRSDAAKAWIFFKGRPYLQAGALSLEQAGFTEAAVQRRELRGTKWDQSDLPVDARYVRALRAAGAEILQESRWLNAVSVRCSDACRARIVSLLFVTE